MVERGTAFRESEKILKGSRARSRGLSLVSVLVLISIVMVVAAAMTAVFTMNMNVTQRASNGSIALAEAEAGITEVIYHITRDKNVTDANGKNPKIEWGLNGETIKGTITPGFGTDRAYHVVTFDQSSAYPYSTNNTTLDNDTGYLGRMVPDGMLHIVSTGYCNGQYRTVECVLQKPPFPFGLATSGPIVSVDPITVKGTSSAGVYDPDDDGDRPGHLLTNSPEGVNIGSAPGRKTEISGFVKSSGGVVIAQPAEVRGGVRTFTDASTLIDIDIQKFDFQNVDEDPKGIVTIVDSVYVKDQKLDVMYRYSGPHLVYKGSVTLEKATLYVQGDLTIEGPLQGEGLIVVDGNAHFKSGTSLMGTSKMAVLASGDISIEGDNNYFMGLVYCEGNLKASNISIVGTTVVNSQNSTKGRAELQNVGIISNEETRDMTIEVVTSSEAGKSGSSGDGIIPSLAVSGNAFGFHPDGLKDGHYDTVGIVEKINESTIEPQSETATVQLFDVAVAGGTLPEWQTPPANLVGRSGPLWDTAKKIYDLAATIRELREKYDNPPPLTATPQEWDRWRADRDKFLEMTTPEKREEFKELMVTLGKEIVDYRKGEASSDGSFKDGLAKEDVVKNIRFNLNEYLPESERVKISFWKVYSRRL